MNRVYWKDLSPEQRASVLRRPALTADVDTRRVAQEIIEDVRTNGDRAIRDQTKRLDGVELEDLRLSTEDIDVATKSVSITVRDAVRDAIARIQLFHDACKPQTRQVETAPGVWCERRPVPIQSVGLYVPAGRMPLPSTAIMLGVPSAIAGCPVRRLCVPPRKDGSIDPVVVFAATETGVDTIYKIGGAQAIAAMAYGTESVTKCDKIFGPGNAFVTAAKMQVSQDPEGAAIDMPAGPSEVMVIADDQADPTFIAADLLSQCEHGPDSQAMLVTTSVMVAKEVESALKAQLSDLPGREVALKALSSSSTVVVDSVATAVDVANLYAPEHLIIQTRNVGDIVNQITTAGSVFLGPWTPETLGDYCSGTNHVLPTYGFARSFSGLSVDSFMRNMTVQSATQAGLLALGPTAVTLARAEGLEAHARAVLRRIATGQHLKGSKELVGEA